MLRTGAKDPGAADGVADALGPAGVGLLVGALVVALGLIAFGTARTVGPEAAAVALVAGVAGAVGTGWAASRRRRSPGVDHAAAFFELAEGLDTGICVLGSDERWAWANRSLAARLGVPREQLLGSSPFEFLDDDNQTILRDALDRRRRGDHTSYEIAVTLPDSRRRVLRVTPIPLVGEALGLGGSLTIVEDALGGDEDRINAPEHMLRAILDNAPDGAAIVENRRIVLVNARLGRMGGYESAELIDRDPLEFVHPVDHGVVEDACDSAHDESAPRGGYEFRAVRKDGSTGWLRSVVVPIAWHGRNASLHLCTDITGTREHEERRAARERLQRAVFDHAPTMLLVLDSAGRIEEASRCWLEAVGHERDEALGRSFAEFLDERSARVWSDRLMADLDAGQPMPRGLLCIRCRDGRLEDVRASIRRLPAGSAEGERVLVALDQLGAHAELEAQVRQSQRLEALGTLAGGIAHDFNNILFAILGYADMALDHAPDEGPLRNDLGEIARAARRAQALVQQIVSFARGSDDEVRPLDPRPVVRESLKLMRSLAPASISFRERIDRELPRVLANPASLHQVVVNLVTNAIEAMRQSGELTVSLRATRRGDTPAVVLAVEDTGPGVPEEIRDRIFEPMFTTKPAGTGTGLGLSVVRGIVDELSGSIRVTDGAGGGARFEVVVPAAEAETPDEGAGAASGRRVAGSGDLVLVVDDEQPLVELMSTMLRSIGYRVEAFTDPGQALAAFRSDPGQWDLVITDQTMPGLTGDALATEMLSARPELPIVLCTGFSETIDEERARALGIGGFLMKPFTMEALVRQIEALRPDRAAGLSS
ncbi:MAG: hypothetical protein Kow0062_17980 [Acidobacteriota bacterium]